MIEREQILDTTTTVRVKPERIGDLGRHEVKGLRGYQVRRFAQREAFVFSTLSANVLELMGSIHVGQS
jgi:hypothetical protein